MIQGLDVLILTAGVLLFVFAAYVAERPIKRREARLRVLILQAEATRLGNLAGDENSRVDALCALARVQGALSIMLIYDCDWATDRAAEYPDRTTGLTV